MAKNRLWIILGALVLMVVAIGSVLVTLLVVNRGRSLDLSGFQPSYAIEGVTIVDDEEALQNAVDEMFSNQVSISLSYQYDLYSKNGRDFTGYLANPKENGHDMAIIIYADAAHTDPIFTSKLLRPGTAFEHITLDRRLDPGSHNLVVGFTLVDFEDGVQKIIGSQPLGLRFNVMDENGNFAQTQTPGTEVSEAEPEDSDTETTESPDMETAEESA